MNLLFDKEIKVLTILDKTYQKLFDTFLHFLKHKFNYWLILIILSKKLLGSSQKVR